MSSPCHVELILQKAEDIVAKPTSQAKRQGRVKTPAHKRFGDLRADGGGRDKAFYRGPTVAPTSDCSEPPYALQGCASIVCMW